MERPKLTFGLPEWADKDEFWADFDKKIAGKHGVHHVYVTLNIHGVTICKLDVDYAIGKKYLGTVTIGGE